MHSRTRTRTGVGKYTHSLGDHPEKDWPDLSYYDKNRYYRDYDRVRRHGDTIKTARAAMWAAQDGRCYLCQRPFGPDLMAIIEHDHRCCPNNKSCPDCRRGLACERCNKIIGFADDDPDLLEVIAGNLRPARNAVTDRLDARTA